MLNTIAGFGYVDRIFITAARSMGASDFQMFRHVLLPAALPVILTGLRIGFTVALLSILGSETIASLAGLGHRIVHLAEAMETARMFAYIAFAVVIAAILNTVVTLARTQGASGDERRTIAVRAAPRISRRRPARVRIPALGAARGARGAVPALGGRRALVGRPDLPEPAVAGAGLARRAVRDQRRAGGAADHASGSSRSRSRFRS